MRILFVVRLYSHLTSVVTCRTWIPKGMPAFYRLLEAIHRRGWQADVILLCKQDLEVAGLPARFRCEGLESVLFEAVPYGGIATNRPGWLRREFRQLLCVLSRVFRKRYDLIYCDRGHVMFGALVAGLGRPVVIRLFGVANLPNVLADHPRGLVSTLLRASYRAPFRFVICTDDGSPGSTFMQTWLAPSVPRVLLMNGVDPGTNENVARDLRRDHGLPAETLIMLSVGRLETDRGLNHLIRGLGDVSPGGRPFCLFLVGDGSMHGELKREATQCGISEKVIFVGAVPHEEIQIYLDQGDVFFSLSKLANLNNSVLEALSAGKCVITFDACSSSGRDACFRESELRAAVILIDREAIHETLVTCIENLLIDPDLVQEKGARARAYARRHLRGWSDRIDTEIRMLELVAAS